MSAYTLPPEPVCELDGWRYVYTVGIPSERHGIIYTDIYEWKGGEGNG